MLDTTSHQQIQKIASGEQEASSREVRLLACMLLESSAIIATLEIELKYKNATIAELTRTVEQKTLLINGQLKDDMEDFTSILLSRFR